MPSDPGTPQGGWSARVRPRVIIPGSISGATLRIDRAVCEAVAAGAKIIQILGAPGSGRSTALRYLERELADAMLEYMDAPCDGAAVDALVSLGRVVVIAPGTELFRIDTAVLQLAPWGEDELFEWAIGIPQDQRRTFVERAGRVMDQLGSSSPEVLDAVWGELAIDVTIESAASALRSALTRNDPGLEQAMQLAGSAAWWGIHGQTLLATEVLAKHPLMRRLVRHRPVKHLAASEWVASQLAAGSPEPLRRMSPPELIRGIAERVKGNAAAQQTIEAALAGCTGDCVDAMGASILNLAGHDWKPTFVKGGRPRKLVLASLVRAKWADAALAGADLSGAELNHADLTGANLRGVVAAGAAFCGANLSGATLDHAKLRANLSHASLEGASVCDANFSRAMLLGANLGRVKGSGTRFASTDLRDAVLDHSNIPHARFLRCQIAGLSLRNAALTYAIFSRVDLREAALDDVVLRDARLVGCVLSQVVATGIDAADATFRDCDLTGSVLRAARLPRAKFPGCGLADIWWQGADLREANFTDATFHMGSSRSGLVGSVIAGEGSKTGFYTDDYAAQDYKPPEEISKADLRGADLRGAIVAGVDFYLVDLRGAIYEREQAEWFRKCGAILYARA
jgi:uncharacterized protein YjbI with pentapeptide repeats